MELEDAQELIQLLQQRQAEAAQEWEGKLAMTHLQYRKQLRAKDAEIERLNADLEAQKDDGITEPHPSDD